MHLVIVIPTYNERPNLAALVKRLRRSCTGMTARTSLLVVDDASPDGTAELVRDLQATEPDLHLLLGTRAGLGSAHLRGIRHAVDTLCADVVLQMDADLSHRPEDVPRLVAALDDSDFVIGSRYVRGGSVGRPWSLARRANSWCANLLARRLPALRGIRDCTAGFRAIRVSLLRRMDLDGLQVTGYAQTIAMLHEARRLGARIREVPVDYVARTEGRSKLGAADIAEFVLSVARLRLRAARASAR